MQPFDPDSPWRSRLPRLPGSDQRASILSFPPPELEPDPLDDPANLLPFPAPPPPPAAPAEVRDLPW
jgi:hypothetical protein